MPLSKELLTALLSLDAYDRGYNQGIQGLEDLPENGDPLQIGGFKLIEQSRFSENSAEVAASFYAAAYEWNGETIIAYRGTDDRYGEFAAGSFLYRGK